jgi:hypothetical protein
MVYIFLYVVIALKIRKLSLIISFQQICSSFPALLSRIVTNRNLVLLCLNFFRLNYTVRRGLCIALNTLKLFAVFTYGKDENSKLRSIT